MNKKELAMKLLVYRMDLGLGEIASRVNVNRRTLHRWRQEAEFRYRLDMERKKYISTLPKELQ